MYVILDGPPGPEAPRLLEVETEDSLSVNVGRWEQRGETWRLGPFYVVPEQGS